MHNGSRFLPSMLAAALLTPAAAVAQTADVLILHNAPDPAAAVVDLYIDGELAVPGFGFRESTGVVALPADAEIVIGVAPGPGSTAEDILATFPITLSSTESYVVIASGTISPGLPTNPDGVDVAFDLIPFAGLRTSAGAAEVALLAYHGAPDAPSVDVNAVGVGTLFGGLRFKEYSAGYLDVPVDNYTLEVTLAGDPEAVVKTYVAPLSGLGGGAAVVFASGYLNETGEYGFGLFAALPDGAVIELPLGSTVSTDAASFGALKASF